MSYPKSFREAVLNHLSKGHTLSETCLLFSVSESSVGRWKRNKRKTGSVERQPRPSNPYKIDNEKLKSYLKQHPDAYLNEIAAYFNVTESGISKALSRLKITRKKSLHFTKSETK